jgi:hypothetical protein
MSIRVVFRSWSDWLNNLILARANELWGGRLDRERALWIHNRAITEGIAMTDTLSDACKDKLKAVEDSLLNILTIVRRPEVDTFAVDSLELHVSRTEVDNAEPSRARIALNATAQVFPGWQRHCYLGLRAACAS